MVGRAPKEIIDGRTPQGVRGLKFIFRNGFIIQRGRTPQGVRGLKSLSFTPIVSVTSSHPARGAWIEIVVTYNGQSVTKSHPARGAWIEIYGGRAQYQRRNCRTPQGVRGLKSLCVLRLGRQLGRRTPQGVRGLKYLLLFGKQTRRASHPARGAWIEINPAISGCRMGLVAARKGCVD